MKKTIKSVKEFFYEWFPYLFGKGIWPLASKGLTQAFSIDPYIHYVNISKTQMDFLFSGFFYECYTCLNVPAIKTIGVYQLGLSRIHHYIQLVKWVNPVIVCLFISNETPDNTLTLEIVSYNV